MELSSTPEQEMQQGNATRASQASVSAALAVASSLHGETGVRFPGEDGGRSLAEMAQRDLDAALQLLTDRAQYITGSSGAAIALRRSGKNDMLCRASTGSTAPELGTLLSTEFGLSGESVRTRQALRCDDAGRDARVNQEVCSQMGIASVVVMPVVNDDEVLGVFELFSGKAHAFGERDLSALQRLSEMVETAVRLARAAEEIPERLKSAGVSAVEDADEILETQEPVVEVDAEAAMAAPAAPEPAAIEVPQATLAPETVAEPNRENPGIVPEVDPADALFEPGLAALPVAHGADPAETGPRNSASAKKPRFWSAAVNISGDTQKPGESDQSHVPPVFRNLKKCEACGFPISSGRALCVECEEKKWRGQLRMPQRTSVRSSSGAAAAAAPAPDVPKEIRNWLASPASAVKAGPTKGRNAESKPAESKPMDFKPALVDPKASASNPVAAKIAQTAQAPVPDLVFSATVEPSQSWLARNKIIVGVLLLVAATVAAILLLR